ncbi:olfactory receptor 10V1-like [Tachyglossus aculeatus]|uniref:olfactory receptor 10V1-like n=1 Tax=Tachyglossus aculeatus TaxID=9261 RepID=UPI0018F6CBD9|nr:olfactory receptor 10V1-like [Tachyglossus aculeatus]
MGDENQTGTIYFHFHPFSMVPGVQMLIFVAFLLMYLVSILGNVTVGLLIWANPSLHSPMYFFLANLAALEICYSSTIAPLTLANVLSVGNGFISLVGCGTQMFFFIFLGSTDCIVLAVMAYDRFVAICQPLLYPLIMRRQLCVRLAVGSLALGLTMAVPLTVLIFRLPFRRNGEIGLFYCDVLPVIRLASADTRLHEAVVLAFSVVALTIPFLFIATSYVFIVATVLRIRSAEGRSKAFSTCSSHLTVVVLQYGCTSLIYLCPSSSYSPERGRVLSVIYTFITPVLNPVIYGLRNQEFKNALKRALRKDKGEWSMLQFQSNQGFPEDCAIIDIVTTSIAAQN